MFRILAGQGYSGRVRVYAGYLLGKAGEWPIEFFPAGDIRTTILTMPEYDPPDVITKVASTKVYDE